VEFTGKDSGLASRTAIRAPSLLLALFLAGGVLLTLSSCFVHPVAPLSLAILIFLLAWAFKNPRTGLVLLLVVGAVSNIISLIVTAGDVGGQSVGAGTLLRDLVFFTVLAGWLIRMVSEKRKIHIASKYPFLFMLIVLFFVAIAPSRLTALLEFRNAAFYVLIVYVTADVFTTKEQIRSALTVVGVLGALLAIFGIFQPLTNASLLEWIGFKEKANAFGEHIICHYPYPWSPFARSTAAIDDPIVFGVFMVFHLLTLNGLRRFYKGNSSRTLFAIGLGLMFAAVALSLSRTAWYSFLIALLMMSFLSKNPRLIIACSLIILVVFVVAINLPDNPMVNRFFQQNKFEQESDQGRIEDFEKTFRILRGNSFLGVGLGSQGSAKDRFSSTYKYSGIFEIATDNYYLQMICETGLVGLFAYLALLGFFTVHAFSLYLRTRDPQFKAIAGAIVMCLLTVWFANATSSVSASRIFVHFFWFLIGILYAIRKIESQAVANE
jgi:putative inorganic carbon (hco3(-)) transporter